MLRVNTLIGFGTDAAFEGTLQIGHSGADGSGSHNLIYGFSLYTGIDLCIGYNGEGELSQASGSTVTAGHTLYVGQQGGGTGTYDMAGGSLSSAVNEYIGYSGNGTMNQSGGTHTVTGSLYLGLMSTGVGNYTMIAGQMGAPTLDADEETIGVMGAGTFTQNAGTNSVASTLWIASVVGSHGTYNLNGGALNAPTVNVGTTVGGTAEFNWNNGTLNADTVTVYTGGTLNVGVTPEWICSGTLNVHGGTVGMESTDLHIAGPSAALDVTGGSLMAKELRIGSAASGAVTQSGGSVAAQGSMTMARYGGSSGTYTLDAGSLSVGGAGYVGDRGTATFTQNGGTVVLAGNLYLGYGPNGHGKYELFGGSLTVNELFVGYEGTGVFKRLAGTTLNAAKVHVAEGSSMTTADHWLVPVYLGIFGSTVDAGVKSITPDGLGDGALCEMTHGTLDAGDLVIGDGQSGRMHQTGGSTRLTGKLVLGHSAGGHGEYEMSGNSYLESIAEDIGGEGSGSVDQSGGTHACTGSLTIGAGSGSIGCYSISGGDLTAAELTVGGSGTGMFQMTTGSAQVTVTKKMHVGSGGSVSFAPATYMHMTGAAFENESTDPVALAGLANLTMIFEGGAGVIDPFEVAGRDLGTADAGFHLNFVLGTLQIGGADIGQVRLVDLFDNELDGSLGNEALYVNALIVDAGSLLDLNGLNLYCQTISIDPGATILLNGGHLFEAPCPSLPALA